MSSAIVLHKGDRIPGTRLRYLEDLRKEGYKRVCRFVCDCGNEIEKNLYWVRHLAVTSCGCYRSELTTAKNTKHGNAHRNKMSGAYRSWKAMKWRVSFNENYKNVKICDRWLGDDGFMNFYKDMGDRPKGMTVERVDLNLGYSPDNCIWGNRYIQSNNRSTNKLITIGGETKTIAQWCRCKGIGYYLIKQRRKRGMTIEEALTTPLNQSKRGLLRDTLIAPIVLEEYVDPRKPKST